MTAGGRKGGAPLPAISRQGAGALAPAGAIFLIHVNKVVVVEFTGEFQDGMNALLESVMGGVGGLAPHVCL